MSLFVKARLCNKGYIIKKFATYGFNYSRMKFTISNMQRSHIKSAERYMNSK